MSAMQVEAIKAKEQYRQQMLQHQNSNTSEELDNADKTTTPTEQQKSKKTKKSKSKKKTNSNTTEISSTTTTAATNLTTDDSITLTKASKSKKTANGSLKGQKSQPLSTALTSLIIFLLMVVFNVVLIYMIMFKNPEIAEKLVEAIPHQYRDWILTKTEIFRLRVTDWISDFRTPPEEH